MAKSPEMSLWSSEKQLVMTFLRGKQNMTVGMIMASLVLTVVYLFWGAPAWGMWGRDEEFLFAIRMALILTCLIFIFALRGQIASVDYLILGRGEHLRNAMRRANRLFIFGIYLILADLALLALSVEMRLGFAAIIAMVVVAGLAYTGWSSGTAPPEPQAPPGPQMRPPMMRSR